MGLSFWSHNDLIMKDFILSLILHNTMQVLSTKIFIFFILLKEAHGYYKIVLYFGCMEIYKEKETRKQSKISLVSTKITNTRKKYFLYQIDFVALGIINSNSTDYIGCLIHLGWFCSCNMTFLKNILTYFNAGPLTSEEMLSGKNGFLNFNLIFIIWKESKILVSLQINFWLQQM